MLEKQNDPCIEVVDLLNKKRAGQNISETSYLIKPNMIIALN